jgi:hypothetical protein
MITKLQEDAMKKLLVLFSLVFVLVGLFGGFQISKSATLLPQCSTLFCRDSMWPQCQAIACLCVDALGNQYESNCANWCPHNCPIIE